MKDKPVMSRAEWVLQWLMLAIALSLLAFAGKAHGADGCADNGVPVAGVDGQPSPGWMERSMLVMANACRTSPIDYRDFYLPGAGRILEAYPAQAPLRWARGLGSSARWHSIDMATHDCLRHNDCDESRTWAARIGAYYPGWSLIGENIAGGFTDPINVIGGLVADPYMGAPAPDRSGYDGHRWNIMYAWYTELGCGFATGPGLYQRYFTQDFGLPGTIPALCSPIAAGTHVFLFGDTCFLATWDAAAAPSSAELVLGGARLPMSLHLGTLSRGTWRFVTPMGSACRSYHFEFKDARGQAWRYPAHGELRTFLEGGCTEAFVETRGCPADFDSSGTVAPMDIFEFLGAWLGGDLRADVDGDGVLKASDIFAFVSAWLSGC